jgi:RNA polymerase sigma factor (sigma-70 family)
MAEPRPLVRVDMEGPSTSEIEEVRRLAFREARRRFVSRESADDMAQEAATRFVLRFPFVEAAGAWVRVVVQNLVRQRNARRAQRQLLEEIYREPIEDPLTELENRNLLQAILERLPARDRTLAQMALDGRSRSEIGRAVGLPTGAVGANLARVTERAGRVRAALFSENSKKSGPGR